jgi:hypothetical protein
MEKLVQLLQEKTGMSEDMSRQAATIAFEFFKEKLPDSIGDKLDEFAAGDGELGFDDVADMLPGGLGKMAGGLFGND